MIEKIGAVILLLISIFTFGIFKGKQDEKNKQNDKILQKIRGTRKRRNSRINDTSLDDLKWLQEHNND